jgi:hypothetical protein
MHVLAVRRLSWIASLALLAAACGITPSAASPSPTPSNAPASPSATPVPSVEPSTSPVPSVPPTGWQRAGTMVFARLGASSALLKDGTILVVGNEACVAAGEPTGSERAEVYDPSTVSWSEVGSLNKERAAPALVPLHDGGAMVLGGTNPQSQPYSSTKVYVPADRAWSDGPLMLRAGATRAVTFPDGSVLAVGRGRAEILDSGGTAWRRVKAPPATVLADGLILADGAALLTGEDDGAVLLRFDPETEAWAYWGPPDVLRPYLIDLGDGSLLALGDDEGGGHVQRYDPATKSWVESGQMAQGRIRSQVTVLPDGRVLVAGGVELHSEAVEGGYSVTEGAPLDSTEIYDRATDAWSAGPRLLEPRQGGQAITLADGSVVVFGGYRDVPDTPNPDTGTPGPCPTPRASTERLYAVP